MSKLEIRAYDPALDVAIVCDTFATSARQTFPLSLIRKSAAVEYLREILQRGQARAVVATFDDLVIGWGAAIGDTLIFAFTKVDYRKRGIARQVVQALGLDDSAVKVAIWTRGCEKVNRARPGRLTSVVCEELS